MIEYYNPSTAKVFYLEASPAVMRKQGQINDKHKPSHQEILAAGYYLRVDLTCDAATHKLVAGEAIDGETISRVVVVEKTTEEKAEYAQKIADAAELADEKLASVIVGKTFTQVSTYIDTNVNDLASAKAGMKVLAKEILIIRKELGI